MNESLYQTENHTVVTYAWPNFGKLPGTLLTLKLNMFSSKYLTRYVINLTSSPFH